MITLPKLPRHTRYTVTSINGSRALKMESDGGYANLLHPLASGQAPVGERGRVPGAAELVDQQHAESLTGERERAQRVIAARAA